MNSPQRLRDALIDPPMRHYLERKFAHVPPAELAVRTEEALRFLYISHECTGPIPVSREIDDIWHALILQTQEYVALCDRLPTGHYIHHSSNDYLGWFDPSVGGPNDLADDVRMLALYAANFGPFCEAGAAHWLLARQLMQRDGWSLAMLNDWLQAGRREVTTCDFNAGGPAVLSANVAFNLSQFRGERSAAASSPTSLPTVSTSPPAR